MAADDPPDASGAMSARRASVTALAGVLGAVALMLLLATWAATIGPDEVVRAEGNPPTYETTMPTSATSSATPPTSNALPHGSGDRDLLFTVVTIVASLLGAVVMLAVVLSLLRWLLTRDWKRHRKEPEPADVAFEPLDAPALVAQTLTAGAPAQRALLAEGSPRNAIVACWHHFEEQAALAGVERRPWETSSEFTLRVLDRLAADSAAVTTLAELYRAARHSTHEITEADRAEAQVALDAVHRSLGGVSA